MSSPVSTRIPTPEGATARKEVEPTRAPRPGGDLPGPVGTPAPGCSRSRVRGGLPARRRTSAQAAPRGRALGHTTTAARAVSSSRGAPSTSASLRASVSVNSWSPRSLNMSVFGAMPMTSVANLSFV